jgi:hypothetical protein
MIQARPEINCSASQRERQRLAPGECIEILHGGEQLKPAEYLQAIERRPYRHRMPAGRTGLHNEGSDVRDEA